MARGGCCGAGVGRQGYASGEPLGWSADDRVARARTPVAVTVTTGVATPAAAARADPAAVRTVGSGSGRTRVEPGAEQPVGDALLRGRLQRVPQSAAAQEGGGPQQPLHDVQRAGGVSVAQAFADAVETLRLAVGRVDGLEAGERGAGQLRQQLLAADLDRIVVQGREDAVDQTDPVPVSPALHHVRLPRPVRPSGRSARCTVRYERGGDERMQLSGLDLRGSEQFQVGQHPGRGIGQDRQRGAVTALSGRGGAPYGDQAEAVRSLGHFQQQPAAGPEPDDDGPVPRTRTPSAPPEPEVFRGTGVNHSRCGRFAPARR